MKRARGYQIFTENDVPHCLLLHGDHTAEHQFGVADLQRRLSIPSGPDPLGLEGRSMTGPAQAGFARGGPDKVLERLWASRPETGRRRKATPIETLFLEPYHEDDHEWLIGFGRRWGQEDGLSSSWSERSAAIVAYGEVEKAFLRDLRVAIEAQDFALWSGRFSENPFEPGGLALAIPSRVPEKLKTMMRDADLERRRLAAAALATGIESRVAEAPFEGRFKPHRHLSAGWADGFKDLNGRSFETDHPVVFFVNAGDQGANHGWFTVEEIDAWLEGHGPVLKGEPAPSPAL